MTMLRRVVQRPTSVINASTTLRRRTGLTTSAARSAHFSKRRPGRKSYKNSRSDWKNWSDLGKKRRSRGRKCRPSERPGSEKRQKGKRGKNEKRKP